jgi:tRNA pseudouridine38-40 synthase
MREASKFLIGTYDFTSFSSAKTETKDFIRTINYIKINKKGSIISFEISGSGFLYNMVRIIVGTLIDVGSNKLLPQNIKTILEAKDRTKAGKTVQACGHYLKKLGIRRYIIMLFWFIVNI